MSSPVSPTYSSSVPSPYSSSSSNTSYPGENSPISDSHHLDSIPSPVDPANSDVTVYPAGPVSVQSFTSQGDIATPYASDFDYGMVALSSDPKKSQATPLHSLPPSHPPHNAPHLRPHDVSFPKDLNTVYIPSPQRSSHPTSPPFLRSTMNIHPGHEQPHQLQAQVHQLQTQQSHGPPLAIVNVGNDVMFDIDLDDWNSSSVPMHAQHPSNSSYPAVTLDSQPTSRPKQGDLIFNNSLRGYHPAAASAQHHPHEVQHQFYDGTNADPSVPLPQARTSSQHPQYQQHFQAPPTYYSPSRIPYSHQQQFVTVHPAEVSPLDACPADTSYPEATPAGMGSIPGQDGCEPGNYACATDMTPADDLKGDLGISLALTLSAGPSTTQPNWSGERQDLDDIELGDLDAEGDEVDPSEVEQSFGTLQTTPSTTAVKAEGEDETLGDDTDGSRFSEEDSSTDSDDSEFIPGSRQRRRRHSQAAVSSSYPSYGYGEGRSFRTRSGTRYTPYPNDCSTDHSADYMDQQGYNEPSQTGRPRRYTGPPALNSSDLATLSSNYLNFSALASATSNAPRRRPRPTNNLPIPVPVPNLTKKSRGRRVPTVTSIEDLRSVTSAVSRKRQSSGKTARMYLCEVEGCGKCFARGEHLKRHVRSIHTYEKPHRCPYPGCGKDFSRHDNLGQHMRVHKDYVPLTKA